MGITIKKIIDETEMMTLGAIHATFKGKAGAFE